jgi:hypothetical protein
MKHSSTHEFAFQGDDLADEVAKGAASRVLDAVNEP